MRRGLEISPGAVFLHENLAVTYERMGDVNRALESLEALPARERENHPGIRKLYDSLQKKRRDGELSGPEHHLRRGKE